MRRPKPGPRPTAPSVTVGRTAIVFGAVRCGLGALMLADASRLARTLGVPQLASRRTGWITRMVGARELALGVGSLAAVRSGGPLASWFGAQAVTDAGDALAISLALRRGDVHRLVGALVVALGVIGTAADLVALAASSGRVPPPWLGRVYHTHNQPRSP